MMPLLSKIKRNISMKKDNHTEEIIFLGILIIPVIWIALLIAPFIHKGLFNAMDDIFNAFDNPFSITWCSDSLRTVAIFLFNLPFRCRNLLIIIKELPKKEEYGSAKWGNTKQGQ